MCKGPWRELGGGGSRGVKHTVDCVLKNDFNDRNRLLKKYAFPALSVTNSFQMLTLCVILIHYKGPVDDWKNTNIPCKAESRSGSPWLRSKNSHPSLNPRVWQWPTARSPWVAIIHRPGLFQTQCHILIKHLIKALPGFSPYEGCLIAFASLMRQRQLNCLPLAHGFARAWLVHMGSRGPFLPLWWMSYWGGEQP